MLLEESMVLLALNLSSYLILHELTLIPLLLAVIIMLEALNIFKDINAWILSSTLSKIRLKNTNLFDIRLNSSLTEFF